MADLQSKAKQVGLVENLGKQRFQFDIKGLFEPITKAVKDSNQKLLAKIEFTAKAIEEMDESNVHVKASELMNKNGLIHSSLIRPIAKLLISTNKSKFRLRDDPDSHNWNDYKVNG